MNFWSDTLLTTTIARSMPKNLHAGIFKWFWTVLPGQKQLCIFLKNKYGFQVVCFKNVESVHILEFKKTKDGLLKTEDVLFKTKDIQVWTENC